MKFGAIAISTAVLVQLVDMVTAHALCASEAGNERAFVAQPPDIVFTAGVPETKYIPHVYVNWRNGTSVILTDCGADAITTMPGLSLQSTYCVSGSCSIGQQVHVDVANGPATPHVFRFPNGASYLQGAVPVTYDGTSPAGTVGTVDFVRADEFGTVLQKIGTVNVSVVPAAAPSTGFVVTSSAGTVSGDSLTLDHPFTNGASSARVFVQHFSNSSTWNHPIAAWYDTSIARWKIRNEDGTTMPTGLSFSVRIDPSAKKVATAYSGQQHYLLIDDPISNGNPYAVVIATPVSAGNRRMLYPFAVYYSSTDKKWGIHYIGGQNMPTSYTTSFPFRRYEPGFFVKVMGAGQYIDDSLTGDASGMVDTHLANGAGIDIFAAATRRSSNKKFLSRWCWTTHPDALPPYTWPIIATFNTTPLPPPAPKSYNSAQFARFYGVGMSYNTAIVFNEDGAAMAETTPVNVWGKYRPDCSPY